MTMMSLVAFGREFGKVYDDAKSKLGSEDFAIEYIFPVRLLSSRLIYRFGDVIEDYPGDPRGHSCLLLGFTRRGRPVHVVCAPKDEFLVIITAYEPTLNKWTSNFKARRRM